MNTEMRTGWATDPMTIRGRRHFDWLIGLAAITNFAIRKVESAAVGLRGRTIHSSHAATTSWLKANGARSRLTLIASSGIPVTAGSDDSGIQAANTTEQQRL
jgi:hypothetical protein